ncbi:hypothetical protein OG948_57435 (plasmid) [Embleya sp. NBC_00888]|uniref:hypothetical protein n=1 Tax=Embleya sp. NBC_00888 TaxID=2975960 RepID=UPI002F911447|nr:hypothetical protein OG948_57435 [Embleya sp. NBC_00888]
MKTVVITGGTDGIGHGIARVRLGRGDRVVVVGTDNAEAARIGRLRATGKPAVIAVGKTLPFLDSGTPGRPVAVSEGVAGPPDPRASSPAGARRLHDCTREVLAR